MRLAFLGTPEAAVPSLRALVDHGHDVAVVVTRPDRRRRRGGDPEPSPVKRVALSLGLPTTESLDEVVEAGVEWGVVVAFGALVPTRVLDAVPMVNVHFSLLPRWRGAAPVERAILAGDDVTGVTLMLLEPTLDTGPVLAATPVEVDEKSASELRHELAAVGAQLLVETLAEPDFAARAVAQSGEATYADKITSDDRQLDLTMDGATFVRTVRLGRARAVVGGVGVTVERAALAPSDLPAGQVRVVDGALLFGVRGGAVEVLDVRPDGGRSMSALAWWRGRRVESATWG